MLDNMKAYVFDIIVSPLVEYASVTWLLDKKCYKTALVKGTT